MSAAAAALGQQGAGSDARSGTEWFELGLAGSVAPYTRLQCFLHALERGLNSVRTTAYCYYCIGQRMGRHGASNNVTIAGDEVTRIQCYTRSTDLDPDTSNARFWHAIGHCGGGKVEGNEQTEMECFLRALSIDSKYSPAWNSLAIKLDGKTAKIALDDGEEQSYSEKECYVMALISDPMYSPSWRNLGLEGGGVVASRQYSKAECFGKAVESDHEYTSAWNSFGTAGGGQVNGKRYTAAECYARSIQMDPTHMHAWQNLASVGGGQVFGHLYSKCQCESRAWFYRGKSGGKTVSGHRYEARDCYQQAIERDSEYVAAWEAYGSAGGGQVKDDPQFDTFTPPQCFRRAKELGWT